MQRLLSTSMHVSPCQTLSLPQSLWLWSPLPPLSVLLGSVPQAYWHWSQSVCTDRRGAAHRQPPLHLRQDSTAPFPRGRSLRPGWNTGRRVKRSQEWSGMAIQRTGQAGSRFNAEVQGSMRDRFSFLNQIPKQLLCRSRLWWILSATVSSPGNLLPGRLNPSPIYLNHLLLLSGERLKAWLDLMLIGKNEWIWQVMCPSGEEEPVLLIWGSSLWKSSALEYGQQFV